MSSVALVSPCYDNSGTIVDCGDPSAVTDNAGNLTPQFLGSTSGTAKDLTSIASPVTPSQVGATAAGGGTSLGPSALSTIFTGLGQVGVQAVAQATGVSKPPTTTLFGAGNSTSSMTGIFLLIAALILAFFAFGGRKHLSGE